MKFRGGWIAINVTACVRPLTANTATAWLVFILHWAAENDETTFLFNSAENTDTSLQFKVLQGMDTDAASVSAAALAPGRSR